MNNGEKDEATFLCSSELVVPRMELLPAGRVRMRTGCSLNVIVCGHTHTHKHLSVFTCSTDLLDYIHR